MEKITLETQYGIYSVGTINRDLDINAIFEELIIPVLLAAGYQQQTIDRYIGEA